jgi:L-threonylcarbamoyladenylate synthase
MTLVLKRAAGVLDEVTGGQDTVGLRIPNHPLALALLKQFGGALVAPSANKFGRLSPTTAADVRAEFGDELAMVLDGGPCEVGIESTIIDLTAARPRILRPGMLTVAQIMTVLGDKFDDVQKATKDDSMSVVPDADKDDVRVPGSLASHYAPVTPLYLIESSEFKTYIDEQTKIDRNIAVVSFLAPLDGFSNRSWVTLTKNPRSFAQKIYGALRKLDHLEPRMIVVEAPPLDAGLLKAAEDDWSAINDRLKRAAFKDQASS